MLRPAFPEYHVIGHERLTHDDNEEEMPPVCQYPDREQTYAEATGSMPILSDTLEQRSI